MRKCGHSAMPGVPVCVGRVVAETLTRRPGGGFAWYVEAREQRHANQVNTAPARADNAKVAESGEVRHWCSFSAGNE